MTHKKQRLDKSMLGITDTPKPALVTKTLQKQAQAEEDPKERTTFFISESVRQILRKVKFDTGQTYSESVEKAVVAMFGEQE